MKALTLHEPWAVLLADGVKNIETRSWGTNHRGPVAIHAGARKLWQLEMAGEMPYEMYLRRVDIVDPDGMPFGAVIGVRTLTHCLRMTPEVIDRLAPRGSAEHDLGDWITGRYAWVFLDAEMDTAYRNWVANPIPANGKQGLWEWRHPDEKEG